MSDVVSPDAPTTGSEEAQTGGKVSLMDKVKAKAKTGTKKLKAKLNKNPDAGTPTEGAAGGDSSSASSSDEEEEAPVNNAVSGMTQPEYEKKLNEGDPAVIAGTNSAATQGEKETELSKDFEGLSTGDKAPAPDSTGAEKPVTEKATDSLYAAKDQTAEKVGSDKPVTEKAADSLYAAKDQAAEKLGTGGTAGGASVTDSLPEQVKPSEETKQATSDYYNKAAGAATDYYNIAAGKASQLTGKTQDTAKDVTESGSTGEVADKAADTGKSWSQWAAEKVGYGKDVAAEKLPATEDGTSAPDAAIGKATEAKDVVSQKAGDVADTASAKAEETSK